MWLKYCNWDSPGCCDILEPVRWVNELKIAFRHRLCSLFNHLWSKRFSNSPPSPVLDRNCCWEKIVFNLWADKSSATIGSLWRVGHGSGCTQLAVDWHYRLNLTLHMNPSLVFRSQKWKQSQNNNCDLFPSVFAKQQCCTFYAILWLHLWKSLTFEWVKWLICDVSKLSL